MNELTILFAFYNVCNSNNISHELLKDIKKLLYKYRRKFQNFVSIANYDKYLNQLLGYIDGLNKNNGVK